jgi:hypothetical protein
MFCRKCGKTLLDGDRFCSYCGAQVIERTETAGGDENLEEVIYNDSSKPVEPLGVVVPKKSIVQAWQEKSESSASKPQTWNLEGFPSAGEEARKTEEIVVDWANRSVDAESEKEVPIVDTIEPIKKKEEVIEEESITGLDLEAELFGRKTNLQFEPNQTSTGSIEKFYTFSKKNEEFQKLLDKEYDRLKKGGLPERKEPINLEKLEIQPKGEDDVTGIEKILQNSTTEAEKVETDLEPQILKEQQTQIVEKFEEEKPIDPIPFVEQVNEPIPEVKTAEKSESDSEEMTKDTNAENTDQVTFPWDEISSVRQEFIDEDANKKKISPVKVIISAVIVLLVFEIGILGVKYFFPESGAAALINEKLGIAVNWVGVQKNTSDSKEPLEDDAKKTDEEAEEVNAVAEVGQNAERNLTEVLDPLLVYNYNIQSISVNETLVYDKTKDYGDKNINNSTPIEDNIWYQDNSGNNVYLDSEIFKTLISFNSLWIDYLNGKNTDVLLQTKEDSSAYKKVKTFSKVGKISEVFSNLELGEMRKGNNGYYIWVKEEIQITENSKVKNKVINNIYYLEPVEQELKIVDYIQY